MVITARLTLTAVAHLACKLHLPQTDRGTKLCPKYSCLHPWWEAPLYAAGADFALMGIKLHNDKVLSKSDKIILRKLQNVDYTL